MPEPDVLVLMPAPSKVDVEPTAPGVLELVAPAPKQGSALAVGSTAAGLRPPGESSVAPIGIPTGPTEDVAPGIPSGDVIPIAGLFGVSGAIWAKLALQPKRTAAIAINGRRNDTSTLQSPQR
jgi:hypothetical protein